MPLFEDNQSPFLTFDEQGSDPSTPASGLWKAYMKSDGLYVIDDAGNVTGPFIDAGGGGATIAGAQYKRTSGNYTTTSTTFVDIDSTNVNFTITTGAHRVRMYLDVTCSVSSGEAIAWEALVDGTAQGGGTGGIRYSTNNGPIHMPVHIEFLTAVLSAGSHTFKWQWRVSSTTGTIRGGTTAPDAPGYFGVEETLLTT